MNARGYCYGIQDGEIREGLKLDGDKKFLTNLPEFDELLHLNCQINMKKVSSDGNCLVEILVLNSQRCHLPTGTTPKLVKVSNGNYFKLFANLILNAKKGEPVNQ